MRSASMRSASAQTNILTAVCAIPSRSAALSPTAGAGETLRETAEGLEGAGTALDDASDAVAGALTSAGTSLDDVQDAIDGAFATAATQQGSVQDTIADVDASLKDQMVTLD